MTVLYFHTNMQNVLLAIMARTTNALPAPKERTRTRQIKLRANSVKTIK